MEVRRRVSATALMLALVLPLLAACGGGGGAAAPTSSAGGAAATTAPATEATMAPMETMAPEATMMPEATADAGTEATAAAEPTAQVGTGSAVTGDGSGATAGASGDVTQIPVEDGATIRIVVNGNPTEQQIYLDGIARFSELFPNVTVQPEVTNDSYETNIQAAFAAGTAPDVFLLPPQLLGAFGPEGLLLPLDEAMTQSGVQKADYVDALINLFTLDDQTYGIPKDFGSLVMFINNGIAEQAGVDPASIQTWSDLQAAAEAMTSGEGASKQYGICLNPDIERVGSQMLQNNNVIIENGTAVFNQESGVAAIDFWKSFQDAGTGELYRNMGRGWCGEAFAGQNAAIVYEGGWLVPYMADPANGAEDIEYTAIQAPTPDGGTPASWLFTNAFGVNANTQYPNASAALAIFLTSARNQSANIPLGLAQPTLKSLASDPYYQENPVAAQLVQAGQNGFSSDTVLGGPILKGEVASAINRSLEAIFLNQSSVADGLNSAATEVDSVLASQ